VSLCLCGFPLCDYMDFNGTERFSIQRRLGSGGFGVVYQVYDRERNSVVALKTLNVSEPDDLYRFKQEFRALADVMHPNLVALYELISDHDQWFFTMELVEGIEFLDYVQEKSYRKPERTNFSAYAPTLPPAKIISEETPTKRLNQNRLPSLPPSPVNLDRLRMVLKQLAEGICALHNAGKLHCDIKPSNILVTQDGRVVLLDFGMVTELFRLGFKRNVSPGGTPVYMAPEQAAGLPLTEASDWYTVGVILYEALTGRLPFLDESVRVLRTKQELDPPPPGKVASNIPEDLDSLCIRLLSRDPEKRPAGSEVLRLLGAGENKPAGTFASSLMRAAPLVGRDRHLNQLGDAFETLRSRHAAAAYIQGRSGMGKSSLVLHFLNELQQCEPETVILVGRCYEQEAVPYKALDSLIDSLSEYLKDLPLTEAIVLMPHDVPALARLFPVLFCSRYRRLRTPSRRSSRSWIRENCGAALLPHCARCSGDWQRKDHWCSS
jgi:eukaryotic-like serine/threonine-protein kinase